MDRSPGDCCALFFPASGLAVRLSAASGSAGLGRPESAMSSCPPSYKNFPTAGRQHGVRPAITPGAKRAGCLGSSSPVVERHPTGPNTAAQPGKGRRARCVSWTFPLALEDNYPGPKTHNRPPVHGLVYGDCDVGVAPWRVGHRTGWSQRCCPAERAPRSVCCLRIPPHRLVKKQTPCTFIDQPLFQITRQLFQ